MTMNKVTITFETSLPPEELHELLCKAIHEQDAEATPKLNDHVLDLKLWQGTTNLGREPLVTINGLPLNLAQSMTLRVAVGSFTLDLNLNGLGDDEDGKTLCRLYRERLAEITRIMNLV